jgi:ATP phosphoribosyltransferase regulatory subunit
MLESLAVAGFDSVLVDIGHAGMIEAVCDVLTLSESARKNFLDILSRKSRPDLEAFLAEAELSPEHQALCLSLLDLHGPRAILERAVSQLVPQVPAAEAALQTMMQTADLLAQLYPNAKLYFDVGEMRGLDYHTGLIFAAYDQRDGSLLAKGGRYDAVGEVFGRARPAIGFSMDLLDLVQLASLQPVQRLGILAPDALDPELQTLVKQLRLSGERVVNALPQQADPAALGCDRLIERKNDIWTIVMATDQQ